MNHYPLIASRLFNAPLMIHPGKLHAIVAGLSDRFGVVPPPAPQAYTTPTGIREKGGYRVLDNGVAVIDVFGILAHRTALQADSSYIQGYDGLARQLAGALADSTVGAILLNIDSPGGEVAGAFQLADQIRAARGTKPIAAVAGDMAASAAYLIASAADSVSVAPTGMAGSIGVVTSHVDMSRALDAAGLTVTYIYAGAHKVDGNPLQPLPAEVAADIQAEIDHYYGLFVDAVAAYRGLDPAAVRGTEARTYIGAHAIAAYLADRVETPDQAIARLAASLSKSAGAPRARGQSMNIFGFGKKRLNLDISVSDPDEAKPTDEPTPGESPADPAQSEEAAPAARPETLSVLAVVKECHAAGVPSLAEHALKAPMTREALAGLIDQAKAVRAVCVAAGLANIAPYLIASGATEAEAKDATCTALAARSAENPVDATPPAQKDSLTRAAFAALHPAKQREFIVAGGNVTD